MKSNLFMILLVIGGIVLMSIFGFSIIPAKEIDQEKTFTLDQINEIQVQLSVYPVHVIRTEAGGEVKIHLYGESSQEVELTSELNNKTVVVGERHRYLCHWPDKLYMDIYLPEDYGKDLAIRISTGAVKLDSMDLANFTLNTSTGGMDAGQLNAENVTIYTSTGGIHINQLNTKALEIKSSTGEVEIDACIVETAAIKTSTGAVTAKKCRGNFDIKTSTGSVFLGYEEFEDQNISIDTTTGSISLQLPETAEFSLEANTTTGGIHSDFPVNMLSDHKVTGQIGTKSNMVRLKTTTGSINILK